MLEFAFQFVTSSFIIFSVAITALIWIGLIASLISFIFPDSKGKG